MKDSGNRAFLAEWASGAWPLIKWLIGDVLLFDIRGTVKVLFWDLVQLGLQVVGMAAIIVFLHSLQSGEPFHRFGIVFELPRSVFGLMVASAGVTLILTASGVAQYLSRRLTSKLARRYEEYTLELILERLKEHGNILDPEDPLLLEPNYAVAAASRAPNYLARTLIEVLTGTMPIFSLVPAVIVMFYLEPIFSLILVLFLAIVSPAYLYVIMRGVNSSDDMREHAKGYSVQKSKAFEFIRGAPRVPDESWERLKDETFAGSTAGFLDGYELRLRIAHMSLLISGFATSVAMFLLINYVGYKLIISNGHWAQVFIYFIPFKFFLGGVRTLFKNYIKIYLFYPFFQPVFRLITGKTPSSDKGISLKEQSELHVSPNDLVEGLNSSVTAIPRGRLVVLLTDRPLNRFNLPLIMQAVTGGNQTVSSNWSDEVYLAQISVSSGNHELEQVIGLPDQTSGEFDSVLSPYINENHINVPQIYKLAGTEGFLNKWAKADAQTKLLLLFLGAAQTDCPCILVDGPAFSSLPEESRENALSYLTDRFVFLVFNDPSRVRRNLKAETLLVTIGNRLRYAIGSKDIQRTIPLLTKEFAKLEARRRAAAEGGPVDDLDDDFLFEQ